MRNIKSLEVFRITSGPLASDERYGANGAFRIRINESKLAVIASDQEGWDHVSVTVEGEERCPTWAEMCYVQRLFFRGDEWVMQLHPPRTQNISYHPFCLHLWRPQREFIPTPPDWMVGPRDAGSGERGPGSGQDKPADAGEPRIPAPESRNPHAKETQLAWVRAGGESGHAV